jgi:inorganic pyrophosphatase
MKLGDLKPKGEVIQVIIETTRGSQHKYAFDPDLKVFKLKKSLPIGTAFPFDFGFIPNTKGGDGDPLDILVLMDEPAFPGCLVECRIIGALMAKQKEKKGKEERNDRIIAISTTCILYKAIRRVQDLSSDLTDQIQDFFKDYNRREGKEFVPIRFVGKGQANKLVEQAKSKS